jgi:5'-methylthioadenosine phosphorylase
MVIQTLIKNTKLAQESVHILAKNLKLERDCECGQALASAIITHKDSIPPETLQKLGLLVDKYF